MHRCLFVALCLGLAACSGDSTATCQDCDGGAIPDQHPPLVDSMSSIDATSLADATTPAPDSTISTDALVISPGIPVQLTFDSANDQNPLWSPDGSKIAFSTQRAHGNFDIWIMNSDGSAQSSLTSLPDNDAVNLPGSAWCQQTDRIVFSSDMSGPEDVWSVKSDGTGLQQHATTAFQDYEPSWSPTCDRIAFQSQRSGNWDIYTIKADGTDLRRLTTDPADDWNPNWSPISDEIIFQSFRTGQWKLWKVPASGGQPSQVTTGSSEDTDCSWSRDGRYVLYSTDAGGSGGARIAFIDMQGSHQPTLVTTGNSYDGAPCWSPDGRHVAFESDRGGGNLDIWVVNLW